MAGRRDSLQKHGVREQNVSVIHGTSLTAGIQNEACDQVHSAGFNPVKTTSSPVPGGQFVADQSIEAYLRGRLFLPDHPTPYLFRPLDARKSTSRHHLLHDPAVSGLQPTRCVPGGVDEATCDTVCTFDGQLLPVNRDPGRNGHQGCIDDIPVNEVSMAPFSVPYGELTRGSALYTCLSV